MEQVKVKPEQLMNCVCRLEEITRFRLNEIEATARLLIKRKLEKLADDGLAGVISAKILENYVAETFNPQFNSIIAEIQEQHNKNHANLMQYAAYAAHSMSASS